MTDTTATEQMDTELVVAASLTASLFHEIALQYGARPELAQFTLETTVYPVGRGEVRLRVIGSWPPGSPNRDLEGLRLFAEVFGLSAPAPKYPGDDPHVAKGDRPWESWDCHGEIAGVHVDAWASVDVEKCGDCSGAGNVDCGDACLCTFECSTCGGNRWLPIELTAAAVTA